MRMNEQDFKVKFTRRYIIGAAGTIALNGMLLFLPGKWARAKSINKSEKQLEINAVENSSKIKIHMPEYAYDGGRVPFSFTVESRMNETDYVRQVHIMSEKNPFPRIASFQFTPNSGKAFARTQIRLSTSQHVIAVAEMNDGSSLTARKWIEVTVNGCKED